MAWQVAGILVDTAVIGFGFWRDERSEKELGLTDDRDGEGLS